MFGPLQSDTIKLLNPARLVTRAYGMVKNRPIVKLGGDAYLAGDATLFVLGGIGSEWNQVSGAALFITTAVMVSAKATNSKWFVCACLLSIPAIAATNLNELVNLEVATIAGTGTFAVSQVFGALSEPLTRRFKNAKSFLKREMFGKPRRNMGILSALSKTGMAIDAWHRRDFGFLSVLAIWTSGDGLIGLSSVVNPERKAKASTNPPAPV